MRWDELFRDLEAQLDAAADAGRDAEVADRSRREAALLGLVDRLRAAVGHPVTLRVQGAGPVAGRLADVGREWLLVTESAARDALVPLAAVTAVGGLPARSARPGAGGRVFARLGLGTALRGIARDRSPVLVSLVDGGVLNGTVDRVGADFLELSEHAPGEPRRRDAVAAVRTVPFAALAVVRSAG